MSYISPGFHYQFHVFLFFKKIELFVLSFHVSLQLYFLHFPQNVCQVEFLHLHFLKDISHVPISLIIFPSCCFFFRPRLARVLLVYSCSISYSGPVVFTRVSDKAIRKLRQGPGGVDISQMPPQLAALQPGARGLRR